jgi:hypothetical protein
VEGIKKGRRNPEFGNNTVDPKAPLDPFPAGRFVPDKTTLNQSNSAPVQARDTGTEPYDWLSGFIED